MDNPTNIFIPKLYKNSLLGTETVPDTKLSANISEYINSRIEKLINSRIEKLINSRIEKLVKPRFETFEHEDIKPNIVALVHELQNSMDNCIKKTGDIVTGHLHILKTPQAKMDVVNKEYVDWLFTTFNEKLETKLPKCDDLDLNFCSIKNVKTPIDLCDAVTKNYVDQKFESLIGINQPSQYIFSKGQILHSTKKTFFFNPGFICPQRIHITSVGFSTSPYKYKIGEKVKLGDINPTKLYFMINNEIKSEYVVEKDVQLGHFLKEFSDPIIFEKGDNLMMVIESMIEDASVNVSFY
jgi:hypothetical protein